MSEDRVAGPSPADIFYTLVFVTTAAGLSTAAVTKGRAYALIALPATELLLVVLAGVLFLRLPQHSTEAPRLLSFGALVLILPAALLMVDFRFGNGETRSEFMALAVVLVQTGLFGSGLVLRARTLPEVRRLKITWPVLSQVCVAAATIAALVTIVGLEASVVSP